MTSKAHNTTKPSKGSFHYTPTQQLPKLSKVETEWDLKKHYYKSETDPQIEKDAKTYENAHRAFIKKYKGKDFISTATKLLTALRDNDKLVAMNEGLRVMRYFSFRTVLNVNDSVAEKKLHQYGDRFRAISTEFTFFPLTLGKIPKTQQTQYLKDPALAKYHYLLKNIFEDAKHHLTEAEENILKLRAKTSRGMWEDATEKILSNRSVTYKKRELKIPEALEVLDTLTPAEKPKLWDAILDEMVQISEFAEHELTAICNNDKVEDVLRGYKQPYSETVQGYENNEHAVEALVEAISTKGFALSRKFYQLKAKLHGVKRITYCNKYDSLGDLPKPTFDTAVTIVRDSFYELSPTYGEIFDRMLEHGQIDVFPKAGKQGGAFMSASIGVPTFVKLNHVSNFKSVETLAHEMGHAIHAELSKSQPPIYESFSTTTAETASTLFEQLVNEKLMRTLSDKDKITFLHDKLTGDIATVQRQIAFFNFELAMHKHIRAEGMATKQELAKMMQQALQAYLGPAVEVSDKDGYSFVYVPHIRYGFYVYTYTYGHLVSNLMVQRYKENTTYLEKIDGFLHAGGSDTVENIFKACDINTMKVETFLESLKTQEAEIKLLEKLTRK
ncbi:hypothetical protein KC887_05535 [Candidatus Kaiserbacteria bacterium]|nr:hypothetical protein [Candidatus Kaiserbacteria bacterium]